MYSTTFCPKKDNFSQNFTFTNLKKVFYRHHAVFSTFISIYDQPFLFSSILAILYIFVINNAFKPLKCRSLLIICYTFLGKSTKRPIEQEIRLFLRSAHQNVLYVINSSLIKSTVFLLGFPFLLSKFGMSLVKSVKFCENQCSLMSGHFHIVSWNSFLENHSSESTSISAQKSPKFLQETLIWN